MTEMWDSMIYNTPMNMRNSLSSDIISMKYERDKESESFCLV